MTKFGKGLVIANLFLALCFLGAAVMVMSSRVDTQSKINEAKKEYGELSSRRGLSEEATLMLQDQLTAADKKIEQNDAATKEALASIDRTRQTAQTTNEEALAKQKTLQAEMEEASSAQAEIRTKVVELTQEFETVTASLDELKATKAGLEDELAKAEIGRKVADQRNAQLARRVAELKKIVGTEQ